MQRHQVVPKKIGASSDNAIFAMVAAWAMQLSKGMVMYLPLGIGSIEVA